MLFEKEVMQFSNYTQIYRFMRKEMGYMFSDFDRLEDIMAKAEKRKRSIASEISELRWWNILRRMTLVREYEDEVFKYNDAKEEWFRLLNESAPL